MRSSQWVILGIFFIVLSSWFIFQDNVWRGSCDFSDPNPATQSDIFACINGEILDPFIWLLNPLGFVFLICGWIEGKAEKKKTKKG